MGRVEEAQQAFEEGDVEASKKVHKTKPMEEKIHSSGGGRYINDIVYGAIDGIVTTFAIVSGVAGASLSSAVVLILGFANLLGDGLSMAIGNYLGTKSELQYHEREREREAWEIKNMPEDERQEIREIYEKKGFKGKDLERAVEIITSDEKVWIDTMMVDELGLFMDDSRSPFKAGLATFVAFVVAGFMPLVAYVLSYFFEYFKQNSFSIAIGATAISLFVVGMARTLVTGKKMLRSGLEIMFVGGVAALGAYIVGYLLRGLATGA